MIIILLMFISNACAFLSGYLVCMIRRRITLRNKIRQQIINYPSLHVKEDSDEWAGQRN